MKPYGQFCPLAQATQLLCERWTLIIIREFIAGSTRFSELQKGVPAISPSLLSLRIKQLIKAGVIERCARNGANSYRLTEAGNELRPVIELLGAWGHRWVRSDLNDGDLDAGLLMWDMRRSVEASVFAGQRVVVQFNYPDAPSGAKNWWLVSEEGEIDLCLDDPGHDVDVLIETSLRTMTKIWICELKFNDAVSAGQVRVSGDPKITKHLQSWLRSSPLSRLGTSATIPELQWRPEH